MSMPTRAARVVALTAGPPERFCGLGPCPGCTFGAPLVARGLQRLGLVDGGVAVESVTPAQLFSLRRAPQVVLR